MGEFFDMMEDGILNSRGEYTGGIGHHYTPRPGKYKCTVCERGFGTIQGLQDHSKAKEHNNTTLN